MNICAFSQDPCPRQSSLPDNTTSTGPALSGPSFFRRLTMRERFLDWIFEHGVSALTWTVLLLLVPMLLTGGM